MKKTDQPKLKIVDFIRWAALILVGAILGVNVYMINANRLVGEQLPMPFGYGAAVVLSGSMEPTFSTGDLIVVREEAAYATDDIVVYQDGNILVVHRILALDGETVTTKGDANNTADVPIALSAIRGRVLFHIPGAGSVVNFLKTPVGIILTIAAAIALVELPRCREKKKDEAERDRIIEEIKRLKEEQTD
ncbi:MAG: signal peptidase I [Oscillospiraceae bacterium]|nr:signal peptidase I [Oscillospiraceae bacterium]